MRERLITGGNMPEDLKAVLEKYGIPLDSTIAFSIRCNGPAEPLLITRTSYVFENGEPLGHDGLVIETRTFKLVEY